MFFCMKKKQDVVEIPDYKVIKLIGAGTFGLVKLVQRNSDKQYFALKQFSKKYLIQNEQVDNTQQEIQMMKDLDHIYIVKMEGMHQNNKYINIIMEFIPGGELYNLITSIKPIRQSQVQIYAAQVLEAIGYLHSKDIVYRDLKPENILITAKGHLKLTDFGLSKRIKDRSYTICGTPEYLAPEVILQKGHSKSVDFWCLGILIFEMIAKQGPFTHDDPVQIYKNVLKNKITYPKRIGSSAKSLLKKLLVQKVDKRLGCLKNGITDIKNHRFFKNINWRDIKNGQITPEFVPKLKNKGDTQYFNCNQAILVKSESVPVDKDPFINFDFNQIFIIQYVQVFLLKNFYFKFQQIIYNKVQQNTIL